MFYPITKNRLIWELKSNAKNKGKGVLNWFIKDINGLKIIYIIYDVYGVKYLFSDLKSNFDDREMLVNGIDYRSQILGIVDEDFDGITNFEEIESNDNEVKISITEDVVEVVGND